MPDIASKYKVFRRLALVWACVVITIVVLRVTEPEVITEIGTAGASIATGVIGILSSVIAFYDRKKRSDKS